MTNNGRAIAGRGTPESTWQAWPELTGLQECPLDTLVPPGRRVVVVAPHPDHEVLGCGGLLATLASRGGHDRWIVSVTNGEASHPGCATWAPERLARRRYRESREGLLRLGSLPDGHVRLEIPDGKVPAHRALLVGSLRVFLLPGDIVFSPWALDGHPDHEATADATAQACERVGCTHMQVPLWMWHWAVPGDERVPWSDLRRLALTQEALQRKAHAIRAHDTQLRARDNGAEAVLTPGKLARFMRPWEYMFFPKGV